MTVDGLLQVKEWAYSEGSQITIHMGEHTEERETSIDRWGMSAFAKGEEIGFLGPDVVAAHCVKLDEAELEIVARTGTQVSYNPVSNAYLGNGIAPIVRMLELGIDVSLATDGGACSNTEDMLEALKFGVLMQKAAAQDPRVLNARDVLRLATVGGAAALGLPADLGALEVGRLADFFVFDPYRLKSVPMHEPISTLVYGGAQANVDTVVIDGKVVLEKGSFSTIDEREFAREVHERAIALSKRIGTFRLMEGRRFTPFQYDRTSRVAPRRIVDAENGRVAVPPQIEDAQLVSPRDGHAE
jgi:5-methylthioadenosine/S-adenosylhomocysteine deaminase